MNNCATFKPLLSGLGPSVCRLWFGGRGGADLATIDLKKSILTLMILLLIIYVSLLRYFKVLRAYIYMSLPFPCLFLQPMSFNLTFVYCCYNLYPWAPFKLFVGLKPTLYILINKSF